jgi:Xaa-Pro aminopeptidase
MVEHDLLDRVRTDRRDLINMDRLKAGMARERLDGIVAISPTNVTYSGGGLLPARPLRLLTFVVTTAEGNQGIVINEADAYYFREYSWVKDIRIFRYVATSFKANQNAIALFADMLQDMGLTKGRLGIEMAYLPVAYSDSLMERMPQVKFVDASSVFEYARLVKTPAEIELCRLAAYYSDKAIHTAFATAKAGDTEKEVVNQMRAVALKLGADDLVHGNLHAGLHSTVVHSWPLEKPLQAGEVVHIDFGAIFGGYCSDLSRNAVVNGAKPEQEAIYGHLWEIEQLVFEHMRPGSIVGQLFSLAQQRFEKYGLVYPWGTLGHSIGLKVHEGFEIVDGSEQVLETGMVVNVEPSHIEQGDARYHLEDTVLITKDGIELLSNFMNTETMFVIR